MMGKPFGVKWLMGVVCFIMILGVFGIVPVVAGDVGTQKIYLNTASEKRLSAAPGINEDLAKAIIKYRKTCGFFKDPEDLLKVPGITQDTYNEIKPRMSPEGFIYCYPKKGIDLEEEDEDAPAIAPTKPLC